MNHPPFLPETNDSIFTSKTRVNQRILGPVFVLDRQTSADSNYKEMAPEQNRHSVLLKS